MERTFDAMLRTYADLAVRVGLDLRPGQDLAVRAPVAAADFVAAVAERAYLAGARYVDVTWRHDGLARARLEHADEESLSHYPPHVADGQRAVVESGGALLSITGDDPDALAGLPSERIAAVRRAAQSALRPVTEKVMADAVNWCVVAAPTPGWAAKVFPDAPEGERVAKLWEAVFAATRADRPDAVEAWRTHLEELEARRAALDARRYAALRFRAPGTDLTVGLADGHRWEGGASRTPGGIRFVANMPTEEVFTAPHRDRIDGAVRASKPLAYDGRLIEGIELRFEGGRVVEARARTHQDALESLLDTDEGARSLGEVALVPHASPISATGMVFLNTLFDENAANHLALGRAYRFCVEGGAAMGDEEAAAAGLNDSLAHVDFMVGSEEMDVDGILPGGSSEAVMRGGEWAM